MLFRCREEFNYKGSLCTGDHRGTGRPVPGRSLAGGGATAGGGADLRVGCIFRRTAFRVAGRWSPALP